MVHHLNPDDWVDNYADQLFAFTRSRVSSEAVAEDIVQDTFLSAWKAKEGFRGDATEKSWLYTICRNKITDHYRKSARELEDYGVEDYGDAYFNKAGHWTADATAHKWAIPSQTVETKEFYKVLDACKDNLKELQKAVFVMKYFDDKDSAEICKVLNITSSNYWVLMHRAKLQLRDCLGANWFDN